MKKVSLFSLAIIGSFIGTLLLFNKSGFAQSLLPDDYHSNAVNSQSPTAASILSFNKTSVDLYSGMANIHVPLLQIDIGGIHVPIELKYHSGGITVAEMPGLAGLGWDLAAGGQISRRVNWFPDEYKNPNPNIGQGPHSLDLGYYYVGKVLNKSNWNSTSFLESFLDLNSSYSDSLLDLEPDEFNFSFGNYSGSFYRSEDGQWRVKSKQNITIDVESEIESDALYQLDEYFTPFSDDEVENPSGSNNEKVASLFTKFILTTPDGYKYVFGGAPTAIEFSRSEIGGTYDSYGQNIGILDDRRNHITANTWYLSKIITPSNDSITFNYKRGKAIFSIQKYKSLAYSNTLFNTYGGGEMHFSVAATNPVYLNSIETFHKRIEFVTSYAQELGPAQYYAINMGDPAPQQFKELIAYNWKDLIYASSTPNTVTIPDWNKQLDSIKVYDKVKQTYTCDYKFFQSSNTSKRRTLDSIAILDLSNNSLVGQFQFSYNNVAQLPNYISLSRDHWGYYNGATEPTPGEWPTRAANNYCVYGLINSIKYPDGGETDFEFEPATYARLINVDPNSTNPITLKDATSSNDPLNGYHIAGVRIKKITDKANYNSLPVTTEYFYMSNYANGGTTSSGILGAYPRYTDIVAYHNYSPPPLDACNGDYTLANQTDDNSEWLNQSKGSFVGYSEVTEKRSDGSYIVNKYTNYDNQDYCDEIADNYVGNPSSWISYITHQNNYRLTSDDLERGNILSQAYYDANNFKVKDIAYSYRNDPARKNSYLKALAHKILGSPANTCNAWATGGGQRLWPYRVYYYKNPLKTVIETDYNGSQSIATTKQYQYDDYGNITQEVTYKSTGEKIQTDTRYNSNADYLGAATGSTAIGIKNLFTNYHIKNYPVEQTTLLFPAPGNPPILFGEKFTAGTLYLYSQTKPVVSNVYKFELDNPSLYYNGTTPTYSFSKITSGNLVYDSRYKLQESIPTYSALFNKPLTVADIQKNTAYTWDNNTHYVSSQTTNAVYADVAYCNFDGSYAASGVDENKGNWDFTNDFVINTDAPMGTACYRLAATHGTGPVNYIQTKNTLTSGKAYILSFWIAGNNYPAVYNGTTLYPGYAPKKTLSNGWKYFEIPITGSGQKIKLNLLEPGTPISITAPLDEIRLYPDNGAMKSYVYDAATGNITATCDASNDVTHYEYDGLGRLMTVKDENGKILKSYTYQYQGAQ